MLVLKLLPENINFNLGTRLGDGADGEVFELSDYNDRVIKFCVLFEYPDTMLEHEYLKRSNALAVLKNTHSDVYAQVYKDEFIGLFNRPIEWSTSGQNYILYYYIMEKLNKISEDERRVFHSILCHEDKNINKNFSIKKINQMLEGMSTALDFDKQKVMLFCEGLKNSKIIHNDLHVRNIMKDNLGNFKLIDFDRCTIK